MTRPVISDIRLRSQQGATRPFLCRTEDGKKYWVKGTKAGNEALCAEWIAGRLGQYLDLPIPDIAQIVVPKKIIANSAMDAASDLGDGIRFGSFHIEGAQEYDNCSLALTDTVLRRRILVFDVWVRNTDRTFERQLGNTGNPNLLWDTANNRLCVIDHNNAFLPDDLFQPGDYSRHVYSDERSRLSPEFKSSATDKMRNAYGFLNEIMSEIPEEWRVLVGQWTK